ncbi:MAG: DNA repair protein RecO [Planctomycetota bacterium]
MSGEPATAIVLRTVEFSETSLVVTLWTREFGRVSALAKGARRPKGPFEGSLDLLSVCRVVVIRKPHAGLDLLTEAKLHRRFRGAEKSLPRTYAGYYVAEMLRLLTDDHDPHPDLYDLTTLTLGKIDGDENVPLALLQFDITALRILGNAPGVDRCTHCGGDIVPAIRQAFALDTSGLVCLICRPLQRQIISIRRNTLETLQRLLRGEDETFPMDRAVYGELRGLISRYIQSLLGKTPRMQPFLPTKMDTGSEA